MKQITLLFLFALASLDGFSQQLKGFTGAIAIGYSAAPNANKTFEAVTAPDITGIKNDFLIVGLNTYYRTGKVILGFNGHLGTQKQYRSSELYALPFIGSAHFRAGYIISSTREYWIYPTIGTGWSGLGLRTSKVNPSVDENQSWQTYWRQPSYELAINADFIASSATENGKTLAILFGLSAGYRATFGNDKLYSVYNDPMTYMNFTKLQGVFFTVSIGFGSFRNSN